MEQQQVPFLLRLKQKQKDIAWTALAFILICLPIVAVGKLIVATDDELDDVVAQSLLEFTTVSRTITGSGTYRYTAAILKVRAVITIQNVHVNKLKAGYWRTTPTNAFDLEVDGYTSRGQQDNGAVLGGIVGGNTYPLIFNGLRLELAFNTAGDFVFFRLGSDDVTGSAELNYKNYNMGGLGRVSSDARIQSNLSVWPLPHLALDVNTACANFATMTGISVDTHYLHRLYFGNTGPCYQGRTDMYVSLADAITSNSGATNSLAWNPRSKVAAEVPGRGFWVHFQRCYAIATENIW